MTDPIASQNKRFISLKWRALALTSALLVIVFTIFLMASRYSSELQLKEQGKDRSQRYVEQLEALLDRQVLRMQALSSLLLQFEGMEQAIRSGNSDIIRQRIDQFWPRFQQEASVNSIVLFSPSDEVMLWQGDPSIPPEMVEKFRSDWNSRSALSCFKTCEVYTVVPLELEGWGKGMVVLGAYMDQVVERLHALSKTEIALAVRRSPDSFEHDNTLSGWSSDVTYSTDQGDTVAMLRQLAKDHGRAEVFNGILVQEGSRFYEVVLRPLRGAVFPRQGELYIISDITTEMLQHQTLQRNGLVFGLVGLIFAELVLLTTLWGPLNRLRAMASVLPMLATQKFTHIRQELNALHRDLPFSDESDVLNSSAMRLSHLLEELQSELHSRAEELEKKTVDLEAEKHFVQGILDTAHALILTQDRTGCIAMANHHCSWITGYDTGELVGKSFFWLLPQSEQLPDLQFQINELANGFRNELHHESAVVRKDGTTMYMAWYHSLLPNGKEGHQILSIALDISERKEAEERLGWLASHDTLTGLFNRRRFSEELQKSISHAKRYERSGAILFFDLDQFKDVNDTSGHKVGDDLLRRVSERLRIEARDSDLIFRLGGDEFAMLVREVDIEGAAKVASRLCDALNGVEVLGNSRVHRVSTSIGVALFPDHGEYVDDLVANADIAMYQAKASGRNGWHIYSPEEQDRERTHERVYWNEKVKEALSTDSLGVAFQPIQNIAQQKLSHFEALLRVSDDDGKPLPTFKFIQSAEASGLIQEVDLRIVDKVLAYKQELERRGVAAVFAINLSGISFRNPNLYDEIARKLKHYGVNPEEIIFEITETSAVEDAVSTAEKMRDIKKLGCKFALDDFGVGFSSLYHIKQLPIDLVKIDGSFVRHLATEAEDRALVKAVVEVSKVFGLTTVAEFVENQEILDILRELGVDYAQGYHISKPEPFDAIWGDRPSQEGVIGAD
ncbi:MAG: EAL domain-containing protein [Ketobacter sp.]|nr:EAL domain-containing protein [Ketobacter sp.]